MIPVKLEIQGLYSYREKQIIDFKQLTAAGLFGIFGDVGSGKSSILEAILLALYGSTERLSERGEKTSMINLQSDEVLINFEFRGGKNNSEIYLATYGVKRNPKNFNELRTAQHQFYKVENGITEPISKNAEEIVGMKKEHFKQTVIIPQGKFREFIDMTPGFRAVMMKDLFGLERFDLSGKTIFLLKSLRENKIRLETKLDSLADYTPEILKVKESKIQELALLIEEEEKKLRLAEESLQKQELLQSKHLKLQELLEEWQLLQVKLPEMESKKRVWKDFLKAKTYLKPVWDQINDLQIDLEKYKVSSADCFRFKDIFVEEIGRLEKEEQDLREKVNKKSERETKIRDLKKVLELQILNSEVEDVRKKHDILKPIVESAIVEKKQIESKIKILEKSIESTNKLDVDQLAEWKSTFKDFGNWGILREKIHFDLEENRKSENSIQSEILEIQSEIPKNEDSISSWLNHLKQQIEKLEIDKELLLEKKGLAKHVHLLLDGNACPLCGAMDHPNPIQADSREEDLQYIGNEIGKLKANLDRIRELEQQLSQQLIRLDNVQEGLEKYQSELKLIEQQEISLLEKLKFEGISSMGDLLRMISTQENEGKKLENFNKEIRELRNFLEKENEILENKQEELRNSTEQLLRITSTIAAKKGEIYNPEFCKPFFDKPTEYISQTIQKVQKDIETTADNWNSKQKVLQETKAKEVTNLANLKNYNSLVLKTENKISELEHEFDQLMKSNGFGEKEKLIELFYHSLDADKVDLEIRQFENRRSIVSSRLDELQKEPGVCEFQLSEFENAHAELQIRKSTLNSSKEEFTILNQNIIDSKSKLKEKQILTTELNVLEVREIHLNELEKLFKGSGFVKYVSAIFLKELCNSANLRYMKLTKNSLSMEIDENNTLWVTDYLNGGKKRLLKTLSGGQTFQASLCLALALAEKIKSLNQADQSFFFLDEGFGALDKHSLRLVFDTLKSLRQENRIVGIISHVEELQQEIEVYAEIKLDSDKGSLVQYSYG